MQRLNVGTHRNVGNIAPAYIRGCEPFEVDQNQWRAPICWSTARGHSPPNTGMAAYSVDDLLARDDIDIVVNLTIPAAHAGVSLQILEAGKQAYSEKPLGYQARGWRTAVVRGGKCGQGLRVGCAPDTFLGAAACKAPAKCN